MRSMWDEHEGDDEACGVLFIDARNTSNEGNRRIMLCVARLEWSSGA